MNIIGLFACLAGVICGDHISIYKGYIVIHSKHIHNAGCNLGMFILVDNKSSLVLLPHECAHGIQNIIWGPLFPFVIAIPSFIRFWYREYKCAKGLGHTLPPYSSIWFEHQCDVWGEKWFATTK